MNRNTLLLIIDAQKDFCSPDGTLYVKGAEKDMARLGKFISENKSKIDHIILTADNHHVLDISHPGFWEDQNGNPPPPFTEITVKKVFEEQWRPRFEKIKAVEYLKKLEIQGEFPHVIWPEHCIIGSSGAAIIDEVIESCKEWERKGNYFEVVIKGTNPLTEHFGALMANVLIDDSPETQLNTRLVNELMSFKKIVVAGEAKSHCVATTVRQMVNIDGLADKLILLEDCMSDVTGFETIAVPIYEKAIGKGARFSLSTDIIIP
jgi:nicotinamidase/pyrazinamidase